MSVKKIFKVGEVVDDVKGVVRAVGRLFKGRRNTTVVPKKKGGQPKEPVVPKNKPDGGNTPAPKPQKRKETLSPLEKKIKTEADANRPNAGKIAQKQILDKRNKSKKASDRDKAVTFAAGAAAVPLLVAGLSPASGGRKNEGGDFMERADKRIQESIDNEAKPKNGYTSRSSTEIISTPQGFKPAKEKKRQRFNPGDSPTKPRLTGKPKDEAKAEPPKATPAVPPALFKKTMGTSFDPKSKMDQDKKKSLEKFVAGNASLKGKTDTQIALAYYRTLKK